MAEILLRPDNRFLSFSTADFSNYGAQPDSVVTIRAPQPDTTFSDTLPQHSETEAVSLAPTSPAGTGLVAPEVSSSSDGTASANVTTAFAPDLHSTPAHSADAAPLVPSPVGTSTAPDILGGHTQPAQDMHPEAPAVAGVAPTAVLQPVDPAADPLAAAVHDASPIVDATTAFALNAVGTTASTVTGAADAAGQAAAGVVDIASGAVATATAPVLDIAHGALADLGAADSVAHAATGVVDVAPGAITTASAPILDTAHDALAGVGGSDPAAGVTTLIDMVSSDNLFDLRDAGAGAQAAASPPNTLDHLIGDAAETSPLLGDTAHHDASGIAAHDIHHDIGF